MKNLTHSATAFNVGEYPLKRVVSIVQDGAVIAHVNDNYGGIKWAEQIVKAVNCHDELVAALRMVLAEYDGGPAVIAAAAALAKVQS